MLLNNQWVSEKIKDKQTKIPGDKWKQIHNEPKFMRHSQPVLKETFIAIHLYLRKERKRLTICLEVLEKEKQSTKGEGNTEGQSRHKWNRDQKIKMKDPWSWELVLWKDDNNW